MSESIDTDPALYDFVPTGTGCLTCYNLAESPETLFLSFQGIQKGDNWTPVFPPPPNLIFELTHSFGCVWTFNDATWFVRWDNSAAQQIIQLRFNPTGDNAFFTTSAGNCSFSEDSDLITPVNNEFYNGSVVVNNMLDSGTAWIPDVMDLINLEPGPEVWANPTPIDESVSVFRFFDKFDKTNVGIKYSTP